MELYLGKDLLLHTALGRAPIWESWDGHFSPRTTEQLCELNRPLTPSTWGLSFLTCTIRECSIIPGSFPAPTFYDPLLVLFIWIKGLTGSWETRRKRTGKDRYLLLPFTFLWFSLIPIFLKAGTCLSSLPFPSLLATSVCKRLLLHTSSSLFDQPDHLARFL